MTEKLLTQELIHELLSVAEAPCISLYMTTHRSHPENKQDTIRYKNLVKQVKESLTEKYPTAEIHKLLESFETLASDDDFWNYTSDGLAVLGSPELFEVIHLHVPVEEMVIVSDSFHIRPLRSILQSKDRYQVLALTLDSVHLYEGNRHSLAEIELPDNFPNSMDEALGKELTDKHSTVASYGGIGGDSNNMHHGHGGKKDQMDIDAERFFRVVANSVYDRYSKHDALPLLLAALPEHHHLFHDVNKNPLVLAEGIEINPQAVSKDELAKLSWKIMEPMYLEKLDLMVGEFNQAKANGLGSDDIDDVIEAAQAGRVDTLYVEEHRVMASRLRNTDTGRFKNNDTTQPVLDDKLDNLGELVEKMGGAVVIIPKEHMPTKTGIACVFRY
jgi:hypothetical protein